MLITVGFVLHLTTAETLGHWCFGVRELSTPGRKKSALLMQALVLLVAPSHRYVLL